MGQGCEQGNQTSASAVARQTSTRGPSRGLLQLTSIQLILALMFRANVPTCVSGPHIYVAFAFDVTMLGWEMCMGWVYAADDARAGDVYTVKELYCCWSCFELSFCLFL